MNNEAKILLYSGNVWYFGEGMLGPLLAIFTQKIGGDILDLAWAWAIYLTVFGILTLYFGAVSDKYDKRLMIFAGYAINAALTFLYVFVSSSAQLFILEAGLGVAAALATPTWDALYDENSKLRNKGTSWGIADGLPKIVTGCAIIVGGYLIRNFSFNALFIVMGIIQVVATYIQGTMVKVKS